MAPLAGASRAHAMQLLAGFALTAITAPALSQVGYQVELVFPAGDEPVAITSADFNDNGSCDIAAVTREPTDLEGLLILWLADGAGGFTATTFTGPDLTNNEVEIAGGDPSTLGRPVSIETTEISCLDCPSSLPDLIIAREDEFLMLLANQEFAPVFEELNFPGIGACCDPFTLTCELRSPAACGSFGGLFLGANTSCEGVDCAPLFGACCTEFSCFIDTQESCEIFFGTVWGGPGTDCDTFDCDSIPRGACCTGDNCLNDFPQASCLAIGGSFVGIGTNCVGNPCGLAMAPDAGSSPYQRGRGVSGPILSPVPNQLRVRKAAHPSGPPPPPPPGPGQSQSPYDIGDDANIGGAGHTEGTNKAVIGLSFGNAQPDDGRVSTRIGDGSGGYPGIDLDEGVAAGPMDLAVADFNGDGSDDYAVANNVSNTISILIYDSEVIDPAEPGMLPAPRGIQWVDPAQIQREYPVGNAPCAIVACHVDAGPTIDVAVLNSDDATIQLFLGNGDGTFADGGLVNVPAGATLLECGDIDQDGDDDLAIGGSVLALGTTGFVGSLVNDGAGTYIAGPTLSVGGELSGLTIGQFAGDASSPLDCAVTSRDTDEMYVLRGVPAVSDCLGDLDADGDVDGDDGTILLAAIGTVVGDAGYLAEADYDSDGAVGLADYAIWYDFYLDFLATGICSS